MPVTKRTVFAAVFIILSWACLATQAWCGHQPPRASQGVLDLREWDFTRGGPVPLSGQWAFYWQAFLPPDSPAPDPDTVIPVPGAWNGIRIKEDPIPGQGFATYRLRILLPEQRGELGLKLLDAATAFTVFANETQIYRAGTPGGDAGSTRPRYAPGVVSLPDLPDTLDLVVHVANFHHWQGGLWETITLGRAADLTLAREEKILFNSLLFGAILIMGIYHLALYGFRPEDPSTLYFGLFCLLVALRPLFHGERLILTLFPDLLGFLPAIKLNYISFYLCVPLFSRYMLTLFPHQVSARVVRVIFWAGILAALTPLALPGPVFTLLMPWFQYATILAVAYGCACGIRAIQAGAPDAGIFIAGFLIFFTTIVNDILYTRQFIQTAHLVPFGLFSFILFQAILLARRFSQAFAMVTRQQQELFEEMIQRRRVERNLLESEKRFRMMADFMPLPLCETDVRLKIIYANKAALAWFGYSEDEIATGVPLAAVLADPGMTNFAQLSRHLKQTREFLVLKKDGSRVWAQIELSPILVSSRLMGHRICFVDLTERKKAEAASLLEAEQSKYILVGQVAGKMAHDFNNILSAVMGNAEFSLMDCRDPELRESLGIILEQTRRGQMLTQNLVAFAKDQDPREECLSLNRKLDLVLNLMRRELEGISVTRDYQSDLADVLADPGMIEQALVNLIQNAVHAMSRTPLPRLRVTTFMEGGYAGIRISDNGCGIPREHHGDIYTPSFTLKGSRDRNQAYDSRIKGTGYGMANVKKYMDKHNGKISFTSARGEGTTFTVKLPATLDECRPDTPPAPPVISGVRGKNILVVEDESAISKVFSSILTHPPFDNRVTVAATGEEAMDIISRERFDLVSLDHILSGPITGMDVYRRIRESDRETPVIFVSGNMEFIASIQKLIQEDSRLSHLSKPCDNPTYAGAVQRWFQAEM